MKNPRTILITGASSGIGEALARHYAKPGTKLCLSGRNEARLHAVSEACRTAGAHIESEVLDVGDTTAMRQWIEKCDDQSPLDLVFANAGIGIGEDEEGLEAAARQTFAINVDGVFNTIFPAIDRMKPRGSGQIAIVASLAAYVASPGAAAYGASKAAVKAYGEALRGSLEPDGIEVSVINPGFVKSRMTDRNTHAMPFKWTGEQAARAIAARLARNKGRISFPWPMVALVWTLRALPMGLIDFVARRMPRS
ncbi:MAG: SDR family NAD(P)-dependent oxidoreductase [Alphaproteobacteria bacterium]